MPIERLKLVYKGRTMQDTCLVSEYNLEDNCKVHLILQKDVSNNPPLPASSSLNSTTNQNTSSRAQSQTTSGAGQPGTAKAVQPKSKFEVILRERLAKHFTSGIVDKIMANLENEINADINSSSLDDLERLAKQKLNISNE